MSPFGNRPQNKRINRRDFLKLGGMAMASAAYGPFHPARDERRDGGLARVCIASISIYKDPDTESPIVGQRFRDELLHIYDEVIPPTGPAYNPRWYRVWGGYAHSAYLQKVRSDYHQPYNKLRPAGELLEVSVPYITSWDFSRFNGWRQYTRIYYGSTHWATGIEPGPDGDLWYKLTSELWDTDYFVPRTLLRPIPDSELSPISPEVPQEEKRVEVNLNNQLLTAFEGSVIVFQTKISSGLRSLGAGPNGIPTATPIGRFNIQSKLPSKHMGQGRLTDDLSDPILLGVPWTAFFHETGVAFHGTYWHDNFGSPMSHGCINMRNDEAKWLFRWTNPINEPTSWEVRARLGTSVQVI
jgi:hypothetical protein